MEKRICVFLDSKVIKTGFSDIENWIVVYCLILLSKASSFETAILILFLYIYETFLDI